MLHWRSTIWRKNWNKLERGDIITAYNGMSINDSGYLRSLVAETAPGTAVRLSVWRDRTVKDVTLTIGEQPKEVASSAGRGTGHGDRVLAGISVEGGNPGPSDRSKLQTEHSPRLLSSERTIGDNKRKKASLTTWPHSLAAPDDLRCTHSDMRGAGLFE
ncbi:MAG TPA: PDZ domain-containing protein [Nitrospiraceae bacterium]|nr:PDZ domain-containing protein [Nitrospiraceae bacterium]